MPTKHLERQKKKKMFQIIKSVSNERKEYLIRLEVKDLNNVFNFERIPQYCFNRN